ncbi:MAG: BON domain-containing protein [Robiginitomaculum sp.]|nr:BON domain-containing protein [Robiginitomaculum sp.]
MRNFITLLLLVSTPLTASCVVGAVSGATSKERSIGRSVDDASAAISLNTRLRRHGGMHGVSVEVADGLALLAGFVSNPEHRLDAERIAWSAPKVIKVANEIEVRNKKGWWAGTKDRYISTQLRAKIIADQYIRSTTINIETRNRVVFLLGIARSNGEIERIVAHARLTPNVKKVVSYMVTPQTRNAPIVPSQPIAEEELLGGIDETE